MSKACSDNGAGAHWLAHYPTAPAEIGAFAGFDMEDRFAKEIQQSISLVSVPLGVETDIRTVLRNNEERRRHALYFLSFFYFSSHMLK